MKRKKKKKNLVARSEFSFDVILIGVDSLYFD